MDHIKGQVPDEAWGNYYEPVSAFLRERGDLQLIQMEARDYGRRVQRRGWNAPANSSAPYLSESGRRRMTYRESGRPPFRKRAIGPIGFDEFTFRFNRRKSWSRGKLFYRLAQQG